MNGNIDGGNVHFYNSVDLVISDIGKRDVVAEQKGKPAVVILKIEALSHALRHLIDKTEYAFIHT